MAGAATAGRPALSASRISSSSTSWRLGAAGVPLTARRSIAVDPANWRYGDLVWVEADGGNLRGARASYRGLVVALDTGSAIKGAARADIYFGYGDKVASIAGRVKQFGRFVMLVPKGIAVEKPAPVPVPPAASPS